MFQYLPHFEDLGVSCRVQSFMDSEMYALSFSPGRTPAKIWATVRASLRRLGTLMRFRKYDIVYMQRELFPFGPPWIERYMKWRGAKLVFDYDDALFIKKSSRYNLLATLFRSPRKTFDLFRLSDCVIAGNDWLRDTAIEHGGHAVTVEVAEDTGRIGMRPPHTNADGVLIGWLGSKSTVKYLRLIEPVLQRIHEQYPNVRFEIVGGGDFDLDGLPLTHTDWSLEGELQALARFDIGLMPLPMEDWAKGKSGGKARTYMAAGVPPVCAAIGYNLELIEPGRTGFLCRSEDDWFEALSQLVEDAELRQYIGSAARADVVERFSPRQQAAKIVEVCSGLLSAAESGEARSATSVQR